MLKYTFDLNSNEGSPYPHAFEAAMAKFGMHFEMIDHEKYIVLGEGQGDYEIATVRTRGYENELCANCLTGPGQMVLDLIAKFEEYQMTPEHEWE